jgi:CRAL/TRIO domain
MTMNPCPICHLDPTSHSFHTINSENPNVNLFYSCPAKATKYFESPGVINHFRQYLEENSHHPWAYILDCEGFTLRHATQIHMSIVLADMIQNTYGKSLKKVWIINSSWPIKIVLNTILTILSDDLKMLIETSDKTVEQIQDMAFF